MKRKGAYELIWGLEFRRVLLRSKRHVGGGRMVEMSRAVGPWREAVRAGTQRAMNGTGPLTGPGEGLAAVVLPRPKSLPGRGGHPAERPDLDQPGRALLDGLTEG